VIEFESLDWNVRSRIVHYGYLTDDEEQIAYCALGSLLYFVIETCLFLGALLQPAWKFIIPDGNSLYFWYLLEWLPIDILVLETTAICRKLVSSADLYLSYPARKTGGLTTKHLVDANKYFIWFLALLRHECFSEGGDQSSFGSVEAGMFGVTFSNWFGSFLGSDGEFFFVVEW
jgi:hypothetical protein